MGTKHTPGPWFVDCDGDGKQNSGWTSTHEEVSDDDVCEVYGGNCDDDETRAANAALIAAAPELLEALRPFAELLESPDEWPDETFECFVDVADIKRAIAAIAKAEAPQ